ncbi:MAG TPA: type IV pilus modification protein PilV [Ramlibacter sp.]
MLSGRCTRVRGNSARRERGAALLEVMVSILITSFGLLALAGLQTKMNSALLEAYQRAQGLVLLEDMTQRIQANQSSHATYIAASLGTGDAPQVDCSGLATRALIDRCEWSNALKGAAEISDADANLGAMIGARGCIEQLQAANAASGVCQPAIYRVTVAWQGFNATVAPAVSCGVDQYGEDDSLRKAVSSRVIVPLPSCS